MLLSVVTVLVGGLVACTAAPGKHIESIDVPGLQLSGSGVSASFGGYHASAGLGGSLNGGPAGGLFAQAGTPDGTSASAGLAGSVGSGGGLYDRSASGSAADSNAQASAGLGGSLNGGPAGGLFAQAGTSDGTSASAGMAGSVGSGGGLYGQAQSGSSANSNAGTEHQGPPPKSQPNGFYDNVFNIPISVLQAVNQLLGGTPNHGGTKAVQTRTISLASSGSSAQSGGEIVVSKAAPGRTFFDDVFNIPISALRSVNDLLNNKNGGQKSTVHH